MSVRQSRDRFDGQQINLYSRSLDADAEEARRSKKVSRLEDDDTGSSTASTLSSREARNAWRWNSS